MQRDDRLVLGQSNRPLGESSTSDDVALLRKTYAIPHWRWNVALIVFVIAALAASVVIPARATLRIVDLFRELDDVIEPARRFTTDLQAGLDREAALATRASMRDSTSLDQYRSVLADNDGQLEALSRLTHKLGGPAAQVVNVVRRNVDSWRRSAYAEPERFTALRSSTTALQMVLAGENQVRRDQVLAAGRLSLVSNALLVLAALAAITDLIVHIVRERRLLHDLRERATREASLRSAAQALAAAYAIGDVEHEIAGIAVSVLPAYGAFVLHLNETSGGAPSLIVQATAGSGVPDPGTTCAFAGSAVERAIQTQTPVQCTLHQLDDLMCDVRIVVPHLSALVIPLHDGRAAKGALVALSKAGFRNDDMIWARTFAHMATLAYEKVRLLDSANDSRHKLELVLESRSRLMRGFSHDVKNPLGAADGYAALILEGIYGELTPQLRESMRRLRRSLTVATSLLEDLGDFARAEAGKLRLNITSVDVAELAEVIAAQYHASADAKALAFEIDVEPDLPLIETDATRLQQVLSNLLSNALKYTDPGPLHCGCLNLPLDRATSRKGSGSTSPTPEREYPKRSGL